jgi:LmbE family N-acetylglucosaminyl deacetylase
MMMRALEAAGLRAYRMAARTTRYATDVLCQSQHGRAPDVFFVEGVKEPQDIGLFLSPHHDDETLFGAATIIKHRPRVVVCFPSERDYGETWEREHETRAALAILGGIFQETLDGRELVEHFRRLDAALQPVRVWAPHLRASHPDHRTVATAAAAVFGARVTTYHTYDERGKVAAGQPVEFEPAWAGQKLRALACYETQIQHPRASAFFMNDLREFYGESV